MKDWPGLITRLRRLIIIIIGQYKFGYYNGNCNDDDSDDDDDDDDGDYGRRS